MLCFTNNLNCSSDISSFFLFYICSTLKYFWSWTGGEWHSQSVPYFSLEIFLYLSDGLKCCTEISRQAYLLQPLWLIIVGKEQMLLIKLTIPSLNSCVWLWHSASEPARSAKWNSSITHFIIYICIFSYWGMSRCRLWKRPVGGIAVIFVTDLDVPSGWSVNTLAILWLFIRHHQQNHLVTTW